MRVKEAEKASYRGRVAVWGLPFLQHSHQVQMASCSGRRSGTCAKAMTTKTSDLVASREQSEMIVGFPLNNML